MSSDSGDLPRDCKGYYYSMERHGTEQNVPRHYFAERNTWMAAI